MSDFVAKQVELVPGFTLAPNSTAPRDPIVPVRFLSNKSINVQARQLPVTSTFSNYNTWRYSASGQYTNALLNGGNVTVKIDRGSGTGKCNGVPYLRLVIQNTSTPSAQYIPAPLLLQTIQFLTPDGTPIQTHDGSALWTNITEAYDDDAWKNISSVVNSNTGYEQGVPYEGNFTTLLFIPLVGNLLGTSDFFLPAVGGDMMMNFYFWPGTSTLINGPACNLVFMSLDVPMQQLDPEEISNQTKIRLSQELSYFYPYERIQRIQQTWTAGQTYSVPLNGIKGDVTMLRFYLRNSLTGEDLYHYQTISSFQLQNSSGNPISGAQYIEDRYNRHVQQVDWTLGSASTHRRKYMFVFSAAKMGWLAMLLNGVKYGSYPFTTNETLQLVMAPAGISEVLFLNWGGGAEVITTGGVFVLVWSTPSNGTQYTVQIPYNATATAIQSALEALVNFQGTVVVTGTYTTGWTLTFGGNYANQPMYDEGYQMQVISQTLTTVTGVTGWTNVAVPSTMVTGVTTFGAYGITSGSTMILDIHAYTLSYIKQRANKGLEVFNSG